jgi:Tol biopolymer transport system component
MGWRRTSIVGVAAAVGLTAAIGAPAYGAFPGSPGLIAFTSLRDGNRNIYTTTGPGGTETKLTMSGADDLQPAFSAVGCRVAFVSYRPSGVSTGKAQVWAMDATGAGQTNLSNSTSDDTEPGWSPDGSEIVYTSTVDGFFQIYVMDATGLNKHRLFPATTQFEDTSPVWSPDGTKIAYVSKRGVHSQIVVVNSDGTSPTVISGASVTDVSPNWSPDGTAITFASTASGNFQVWRMNADGSSRTQLTSGASSSDQPAFSPDGAEIVYRSFLSATTVVTLAISSSGGTPTPVTDQNSSNEEPDWGVTCAAGPVVPEIPLPVVLPMVGMGVTALLVGGKRRFGTRGRSAMPA